MRLSRRTFLRGVLGLSAGVLGGVVYSTKVEPQVLDTTRLTVALPHLPPALAGLTIAQISDLHFGEWMTLERATQIVETVNALNPDVVVVTGDFFSVIHDRALVALDTSFRQLRAPHGVYAILGNHDHWTDAPTVDQAVRATGMTLLRNEHVVIERDGAQLYLAGLDDIWEQQHDLEAALDGIPAESPVILLAHEPDYADTAATDGRVGLQLSGHSHGGQVRLPGQGALQLPYLGQKYDAGKYEIEQMTLYVNRGVGMIAPYVRFGCPPEITFITL
jgi:uncharacterized protein